MNQQPKPKKKSIKANENQKTKIDTNLANQIKIDFHSIYNSQLHQNRSHQLAKIS